MSQNKLSKQELENLILKYGSKHAAWQNSELTISRRTFYYWCESYEIGNDIEDLDRELVETNIKYKRETQKQRDLNRIANKSFREASRCINAFDNLGEEILKELKSMPKPSIPKIKTKGGKSYGLIQLSDLHFNEYVDIIGNKYDWDIASKRVRKHVLECMKVFDAYGIKEVLLVNTGDTLNNDIILDKLLTNVNNRAEAISLAFDILRQVILELSQKYKLSVAFTDGNETRLYKDIGFADRVVSNNFDRTLYLLLKGYFSDTEVNFLGCGIEVMVNFKGTNIVALHGFNMKANNYEQEVAKIINKYSTESVKVDYVISGHIHSTAITPFGSRSGSTVGGNAYSFYGLNLFSRASQNMYIFKEDGSRLAISTDLQNTDGIEGYTYDKTKESYNSVAEDKMKKPTNILQIVI